VGRWDFFGNGEVGGMGLVRAGRVGDGWGYGNGIEQGTGGATAWGGVSFC
jgi:hypothetical protein